MSLSTASGPSVSLEHVRVERSGRLILDDVCATLPSAGNTVIVGPNGAGKTTLLLCLIGEIPFEGNISFGAAGRHAIAYVPQSLYLDRSLPLSVGEFLILGRYRRPLWLGMSAEARRDVAHLLALVRSEKLEKQQMCALSGGEMRRILLAAALAQKPRFLILDEPAAGVDIAGERILWEIVEDARKELGFTQVMVSHNLPLVAHYASHVICLDGTVQAEGAPRKTLTAERMLRLFGIPIHLYPSQCSGEEAGCPQCGAVCVMQNASSSLPLAAPSGQDTGQRIKAVSDV